MNCSTDHPTTESVKCVSVGFDIESGEVTKKAHKSGLLGAVFNITNAVIGTGIVVIPMALYESGFWLGVVMLGVMAWATEVTLSMLVRTGIHADAYTYEDLCQKAFGSFGFYSISIAVIFNELTTLCVYAITLGNATQKIFNYILGENSELIFTDRRLWVLCLMTFIVLPICMLRDISRLAKFSVVSIVSVAFIIFSVVFYCFANGPADGSDLSDIQTFAKPGFIAQTGTFAFAFTSHALVFILYDSMRTPSFANWRTVARTGVAGACFFTLIMGVAGYFTFYQNADGFVLDSYPPTHIFMTMTRLVYVLTIVLTYPLHHNVARYCIFATFFKKSGAGITRMPQTLHVSLSLGIWAFTLIVSVFVTKIGKITTAGGSIFVCYLGFIMPLACHFKLVGPSTPKQAWSLGKTTSDKVCSLVQYFLYVVMFVFGLVVFVVGPVTTFTT